MTVCFFLYRLTLNYGLMGLGLDLKEYALNFFASGVAITSSEIPTSIIALFTLHLIGRKSGLLVLTAVCFGTALVLWLVVPCLSPGSCFLASKIAQMS